MPARMTRVRKFGWWSVRKKSVEFPRIRAALGMPETETNEGDDESPEHDKFDGDTDEDSETIRIICSECKTRTLVRVEHYPKPTIRRIMTRNIWPELEPDAKQPLLPAVEPYLAGGSLYMEAMGFT